LDFDALSTPQQLRGGVVAPHHLQRLHTHPELSTQEQRTAAIVAKELKAVGCEVTENVGKYEKAGQKCFGVVGVMKNGDGRRSCLVRTDLDALPVREETGLPYASTVTTKTTPARKSTSCTPADMTFTSRYSSAWRARWQN
jgi:hypothetical protein